MGKEWQKTNEIVVLTNDADGFSQFFFHYCTEEAGAGSFPVLSAGCQFLLDDRWDKRESVELSVGMVQRNPDYSAFVLEDENVLHVVSVAKILKPLGPQVNNSPNILHSQISQGDIMLRRVDKNLAYPMRRHATVQSVTLNIWWKRIRPQSWKRIRQAQNSPTFLRNFLRPNTKRTATLQ
jgi:hypothetical protein